MRTAVVNMLTVTRRLVAVASISAMTVVWMSQTSFAQSAVDIQEVTSDSGVTAWLVSDDTIPMIALRFAFEGGTTQDTNEKAGLVNLMSGLFDEGAGDREANDFQEALDNAGAEMEFSATSDAMYGSMRMLSENKDEALDLLRDAINSPRFDEAPVNRIRSQIVTQIQAKARDPQTQGRKQYAQALYGNHPYARDSEGTAETLQTITPDDLRAEHDRIFARSNLKIAVVGDIDAETLKADLDRIFGSLPAQADLTSIERVEPKLGEKVLYDFNLPQTTVQLTYPGIERKDPEFFAAYMMNHILGGGTFSSRLFTEVREARGLTYGIGSGLQNLDHTSSLVIGTSSRSDRVGETLEVIREQVKRLADDGPTADELAKAKTYVLGAYAINNLDSSGAIASTLLELQRDDLGIDYIDRRVDEIEAVTLDETKAAAQRLLTVEPSLLVIGPEAKEAEDEPAN